MIPSRKFRYLAAAVFVTAAFLCTHMITPQLARANQLSATVTGSITSGTDYTGTFFAPNTNLAGKTYTIVYQMDDTGGTASYGTWPSCTNGRSNSGLSTPTPLATVTIAGGRSYTVGALPPSLLSSLANTAAVNGGSPETAEQFTTGVTDLTGGIGGSEGASSYIGTNTGVYCHNWDGAYTYTPVGADSTGYYFSADYYNANTFAVITEFTTAVTVSGLNVTSTSAIPTLNPPGKQNFGRPCCDTYKQAALAGEVTPNVVGGTDPINGAVGNMTMHETDFVGGPATHLSFTRYYNSFDTGNVGFGAGWRTTYHRALNLTSSTTSITVTRADGRQDVFTKSGSNWVPQTNVTAALASTSTNYKLTWPDDTVENYNTSGQLTSIVERSGLTTSLSYTTSGLHVVTGPFGHTLTFSYNALNLVTTMTLPDGTNTFGYGYDGYNNLAYVINPDGTAHQFGHNDWPFHNLITDLLDEDGNLYAHWTYDSTGRALTSEHATGSGVDKMSLTYTSTSSTTITDALGNAHTYALTSNSGLVQPTAVTGVPDPFAGGASFTYDTNGFVNGVTDYDGNVTKYTHNSSGEETSRTEAYGTSLARTTTTKWSTSFHLPTEIDAPLGRTTTLGYDSHGNLLTLGMTDGTHSRTFSMTYTTSGQITSYKDALGHTTTWTYDGTGDVKTMVNALGQTTTYNAYDGNGRLLSMTNPLGLTTTFTYDKLGRMLTKDVGGLTTTITWDPGVSKPSKVLYPDSSYLSIGYDDAHRLIQIKDVAGDAIKYIYDNNSNLTNTSVYNPTPTLEMTTTGTYDSQNRLSSMIDGLGNTTTYSYDSQSNLLSVEDPNGHFMQYTYDDLNRLSTVEDPYSGITTTTYDALDDVVSIKDPLSLTTTYTWDGLGDRLSVVSPDTGTSTYSYNAMGLVLTTTDARGKSASYTYDALNRTSTISYTGGQAISYLYDTTTYGIGQLGKMIDPAGTTSWTYDQYSRVLSKTQTANAIGLTTTYSYDTYGRLSTLKYPSGQSLTYSYDTSGRLSAVAFPGNYAANTITYFPFGMASSWAENNLSTYTRGFDQAGYINSIALASTTTANTQTITYDPAHRITELQETGLTNKTYGYDSFDRLTSFFNGTATASYSYDADSNRKTYALSTTTTYNYPGTSNKLSSLFNGTTTTSYGYDASGNITGDGTNTWTFDARGRMATLTAGTTTAAYSVNGFGQRIVKSGSGVPNGGTNEFVYDEQGNMLGEYSSTGGIIEETVYLPNTPVSVLSKGFGIAGFGAPTPLAVVTTGSTIASVTADWLGAPHIIQNASKTVVWNWDHYAFGDNAPNRESKWARHLPVQPTLPGAVQRCRNQSQLQRTSRQLRQRDRQIPPVRSDWTSSGN